MVRDHGWQGHQQKSKELFAFRFKVHKCSKLCHGWRNIINTT
jgi:hypothetical protein